MIVRRLVFFIFTTSLLLSSCTKGSRDSGLQLSLRPTGNPQSELTDKLSLGLRVTDPLSGSEVVLLPLNSRGDFKSSYAGRLELSASSSTGSEFTVTLLVRDLQETVEFFANIYYDPKYLSPKDVAPGDFFGFNDDPQKALNFFILDREGVVPVGIARIRPQENGAVSGKGEILSITFEKRPHEGQKMIRRAPDGTDNQVTGMQWNFSAGSITLDWNEKDAGDYNNDGQVIASDVSPIAFNFGASLTDGDTTNDVAVNFIGGLDQVINASDITKIAFNFGSSIAGYNVYREGNLVPNPNSQQPPQPTVPRPQAQQFTSAGYQFVDSSPGLNPSYFVRPYSLMGEEGITSESVSTVTGNQLPRVNPSVPGTGETTTPIAIAANATDPDGDPLTIAWSSTTGGLFADAAADATTVTFSNFGEHFVDLSVSDGQNPPIQRNFRLVIVQQGGNQLPNVNPVVPSVAKVGQPANVNAGATDPESDPLTINWTTTGGSFANPSAQSTTVTYTQAGPTIINLTVSDGVNAELRFSFNITVSPNSLPTVNPNVPATGQINLPINITANATDPDGDTLTITWSTTGGTIGDASADATTVTYPSAGNKTLNLIVDDGVNSPVGRLFNINCTAPNSPPTISPNVPTLATRNKPLAISAGATDPDGDTLTISWSATGGGAVFADPSADATTVTFSSVGNFSIDLSVTDGKSAPVTDSFPVSVIYSYISDVRPIIDTNCSCHLTDPPAAGYSLKTYNDVFTNRFLVKSRVVEGTMPPGGPLPQNQIDMIVGWIDAGAPNN